VGRQAREPAGPVRAPARAGIEGLVGTSPAGVFARLGEDAGVPEPAGRARVRSQGALGPTTDETVQALQEKK
jgi:hypothetical protein